MDIKLTVPTSNNSSSEINQFGQAIGQPVEGWVDPAPVQTADLTQQMQGNYCHLELLQDHHASQLQAAFSHAAPSLWTYLPYGPFESLEDYEQLIINLNQDDRKQCFSYCIKSIDEDQPLGFCAYLRMAPHMGSIEIGHLSFSPMLQKTPAATEAIFMMIDAVFMLGYRRCEWKCNTLNEPSIKAAKRYGFRYEGTFRQAQVVKGHNRDTAWFSILDSEWEQLRPCYEQWFSENNFNKSGQQKVSLSSLTSKVRQELDHA